MAGDRLPKTPWRALLVLAVTVFTFGAWSEIPAHAGTKSEILIGTHLPLTGVLAGAGQEQMWAYQEAVKDVNAKGGIYLKEYGRKLPVRLVAEDDASIPDRAVQAVEHLIKYWRVDLLLSGFGGALTVMPACQTAEKHHAYYHASIAFIAPWLKYRFKWSTLFFFDLEQSVSVPFQLWNSMPASERPRRPAVIFEDSGDGRTVSSLFQSVARKYGVRFVLTESYPVGNKDYSGLIRRAQAKGVDAILVFSSDKDSLNLVRQMKENRFSVRYLHGWKGYWSGDFWQQLGKDAQYVLCDGFWSEDFPIEGAKELGERYREHFGKPSVSVGSAYALAQILWQAIEKAGSLDGKRVRQAVIDSRFETVMGPVKYQPNGVATFVSTAHQWMNGKQELVYPFKWAKTSVKPAPPWEERK